MGALDEMRRKGFAAEVGFGRRPAVLVVDMMRAFTDPRSPLGTDLDRELEATARLLEAAREVRVPVVFTTTEYGPEMTEAGLFVVKVPSLRGLQRGSEAVALDPRLGRRADEPVVVKRFASAFFETDLAERLRRERIDTLLIAGCTTSGCIRATAVDALQNGFRAIVPRECVGDRSPEAHEANLFDIHSKYGDVVDLDAAIARLRSSGGPA